MLKNITWQNFVVLVVWLLIAWYCVVAMVYYSNDIKTIIKFKRFPFQPKQNDTKDNEGDNTNVDDVFARSKTLRDEIYQILQKATQHKFPKEELVMALQLTVRRYPELQQSGFQVAINHYIACESEKQCFTAFSDEDLQMIWKG